MATRSGFSLVEVILALFVLSVGLLAVARALGLAEGVGGRLRERSRAVFDMHDAAARYHRADTVCLASSGSRRAGRITFSWAPGPAAATRRTTIVSEPPYQGARPESAASVVACP